MRNARSSPLLLLATLGVLFSSIWIGCGAGDDRPNVIVVVVDTLRADHLPDWGYERDTIGAMREFTEEATRFERAYAPSSWTLPSTASLFSGLSPERHRANVRDTRRLNPTVETVPETLQREGWATHAISLNHWVSRKTGFGQGFDHFQDVQVSALGYPDLSVLIRGAREFLASARSPFFLYLQPMNTHGPYRVPPEHRSELLGRPPDSSFGYLDLQKGIQRMRRRFDTEPVLRRSLVEQYDTAIRYSMDSLGALLEELRRDGLYDETLIVVTSDHGEELFDHRGFSHGYSLYEEVLRVPLYIKLPRQHEAAVVEEPVSLLDVAPTLLDLLGLPLPNGIDGISLAPVLRGEAPMPTDRSFTISVHGGPDQRRCVAVGLLDWPWKVIHTASDYQGKRDRVELYQLERDPHESEDLARREDPRARRLHGEMGRRIVELRERAIQLPEGPEPEMDRKTLEALGYL